MSGLIEEKRCRNNALPLLGSTITIMQPGLLPPSIQNSNSGMIYRAGRVITML